MTNVRWRRRLPLAPVALVIVLTAACASEATFRVDTPTLPARDVPSLFTLPDSAGGADATAGTCRSPLLDPRDGTSLRLIRSSGGRGDYEPPSGRYGVGADQLLRIDCGSGRTIGIVAR